MQSILQRKVEPLYKGILGNEFTFDNLRAFVILLVVVFHTAIGYMQPSVEWWYVVDTQKSALFNLFVMNTDVFIMPIMFFIAGYLAVPALQKKGAGVFWLSKGLRIVIP